MSPSTAAAPRSPRAGLLLSLLLTPVLAAIAQPLVAQVPATAPAAPAGAARVDTLEAGGFLQEAAWEARSVGDTARAERLLARLDTVLRRSPVRARPLDMERQGVSYTFRTDHGDQVGAVFKVDGSDIFCPECGADREVAAYRIDRLLGFDLTPMTVRTRVVHQGDTLSGSAMYWVRDAGNPAEAGLTKPDRLRLFDAILGNSDRHPGNWLLIPRGRVVAIDHNRAFEYQPSTRTQTCWETEIDSIADPARLGAPYARFRDLPPDSLAAAVAGIVDGDVAARFVAMRARIVARVEARAADPEAEVARVDCRDD